MNKYFSKRNEGTAAILSILLVSVVGLAFIGAVTVSALGESSIVRHAYASEKAYIAVETGIEEALYRITKDPLLRSFTFSIDGSDVTVGIAVDPANPYQRIITSTAEEVTGKVRSMKLVVLTNAYGGSFDSAVQTGAGGLFMDNNSWIVGNVFSNGSVVPGTGSNCNNHLLIGDVAVAGPTGFLGTVKVESDADGNGGTARGNTIQDSCIEKDAYYTTLIDTTVGGTEYPGNPDPEPVPLPITDIDIQTWKDNITATGNVIGPSLIADCPGQPPYNSGTYYCIMSDTSLGDIKINADLFIKGDVSIVLTGNVWITGDIVFENAGNGRVNIDSSLGPGSVVIVNDGTIDISNNYLIDGSGDPSSFVLLISTSTNVDVEPPAIYASNGSESIVFAAPHGEIRVKNGGTVNATVAEKIRLNQNSSVIFKPNLASFVVLSGDSMSLDIVPDTWQEL